MIFMGTLDNELFHIRGWDKREYGGADFIFYDVDDVNGSMNFNVVINSIFTAFTTLKIKYPEADITDKLSSLSTATFGRTIRSLIYDICREFCRAAGIVAFSQLGRIRNAHFGADIREPLYELLIKLGADEDITSLLYIWEVNNEEVTLIKYIGQGFTVLTVPETIHDYPVKILGSELYMNNEEITRVTIPNGPSVIE